MDRLCNSRAVLAEVDLGRHVVADAHVIELLFQHGFDGFLGPSSTFFTSFVKTGGFVSVSN
jgi:hypothetical protein